MTTDTTQPLDLMHPQALANSGMAWRLEGHVGRTVMALIESGVVILGTEGHRDYWGNYVPSRSEVEAGTLGSVEYANEQMDTDWTAEQFDSGEAYAYAVEQGVV